jgi:ubiquinone/menaquinone biosynthesis C-methylase UbiE
MTDHENRPTRSADHGDCPQTRSLPDYYPTVAADILRQCRPLNGVWVDLGAGKGQVGLMLAQQCPPGVLLLVDPNAEALAAAEQTHACTINCICGRAEHLPLADRSVDLVVSRGSIYFWDNQALGLSEVYRILREGGQAMIGGGLGIDYPLWARQEFIRRRHQGVKQKGPKAYERFLRLRDPKTFTQWARNAGLSRFKLIGEGGKPAEDPRAGSGIWLWFER